MPHYLWYFWDGNKVEFDMAPQVLKILYRQAIIWVSSWQKTSVSRLFSKWYRWFYLTVQSGRIAKLKVSLYIADEYNSQPDDAAYRRIVEYYILL